jgi:hypothetical protein
MAHIEIQVSNNSYTATEDFYIYPSDLFVWGTALQEFPKSTQDKVVLEAGSKSPGYYNYLCLTAFVHDERGHSVLRVEMGDPNGSPLGSEAKFSVFCEPALLNDLGKQICSWIDAEMQEPLVREWKNT